MESNEADGNGSDGSHFKLSEIKKVSVWGENHDLDSVSETNKVGGCISYQPPILSKKAAGCPMC